jgi:hypothetical protein
MARLGGGRLCGSGEPEVSEDSAESAEDFRGSRELVIALDFIEASGYPYNVAALLKRPSRKPSLLSISLCSRNVQNY